MLKDFTFYLYSQSPNLSTHLFSLVTGVFSPNISKFAIDTLYHHCTASTQLQSISNISASPCMAFLSSFQTSTPSHSTEWIKPPKSPKTLKPSKFCSLMVFNHSAASDSISSELTHQSPDQAQCQNDVNEDRDAQKRYLIWCGRRRGICLI